MTTTCEVLAIWPRKSSSSNHRIKFSAMSTQSSHRPGCLGNAWRLSQLIPACEKESTSLCWLSCLPVCNFFCVKCPLNLLHFGPGKNATSLLWKVWECKSPTDQSWVCMQAAWRHIDHARCQHWPHEEPNMCNSRAQHIIPCLPPREAAFGETMVSGESRRIGWSMQHCRCDG